MFYASSEMYWNIFSVLQYVLWIDLNCFMTCHFLVYVPLKLTITQMTHFKVIWFLVR